LRFFKAGLDPIDLKPLNIPSQITHLPIYQKIKNPAAPVASRYFSTF